MQHSAMFGHHDGGHDHERAADDESSDPADVIHPFADSEPANIGEDSDPEQRNREQEKESAAVVDFRGGASAHNVAGDAGDEK